MKNLTTILILFFALQINAQNTYSVDNKPGAPADFSNLQDAIDNVPAGSTLLVQGSPNTYSPGTIDKQIHIIGPGYYLDQNPETQAYGTQVKLSSFSIVSGAEGTTISGIEMYRFISSSSITINNCNNISLNHCAFEAFGSSGGIRITNSKNIQVLNSMNAIIRMLDNLSSNITLRNSLGKINDGDPSTFTVINCTSTVIRNGMTAYNNILSSFSFSGGPSIYNNVILYSGSCDSSNCGSTYYYTDSDNNKIVFLGDPDYQNTYFYEDGGVNSPDGRYQLATNSVAKNAGVLGVDCGMFGGGYRLSGIPNIPNIYEFTIPDTGYTNDGGIPVTIKVRANN